MNNSKNDYLSFAYGLAIVAGGLIGYFTAAGLVFGSVALVGAYQASVNPRNILTILLTSGALLVVMGTRFYNSGKFMPAGLVALLSLIQFGRMAFRFFAR